MEKRKNAGPASGRSFKVFLGASLLVLVMGLPGFADFIVRLDADKTTINVGEELTVRILGKAADPAATGTNGINMWEMGISVPSTDNGVISVKTGLDGNGLFTFVPPSGGYAADPVIVNTPSIGDVRFVGLATQGTQSTTMGVNQFSLLASFTIIGMKQGTVTYTVNGDYLGFDAGLKDRQYLVGSFDAGNSVHTFTVLPEPGCLLILGLGTSLLLSKKNSGKV
jgi:hypothetical protein